MAAHMLAPKNNPLQP